MIAALRSAAGRSATLVVHGTGALNNPPDCGATDGADCADDFCGALAEDDGASFTGSLAQPAATTATTTNTRRQLRICGDRTREDYLGPAAGSRVWRMIGQHSVTEFRFALKRGHKHTRLQSGTTTGVANAQEFGDKREAGGKNMAYGDPPNTPGPYGEYPPYGGQDPQQGGQYPQQGGQYPQYPQQGGQNPQYGGYDQPTTQFGGQTPQYGGYEQPGAPGYPNQPYQQPGAPQWGAPPGGPYGGPPPKKRGWIPIAAIIAVLVLVLGGVGVWWITKGDDGSSKEDVASGTSSSTATSSRSRTTTRTTERTTTSSAAPTGAGDPEAESRLYSALPDGFSDSNCKPIDPDGALARVQCDANTSPTGPTGAIFTIFADQASLDRAFNTSKPITETALLRDCPDNSSSPSSWTYESDPDATAGFVACGMSENNTPQIIWSKYRDLTMGFAQGTDLKALHDWWWEFG